MLQLSRTGAAVLSLLTAMAFSSGSRAAAPPPVAPILPSEFLGWTNAYRLENEQAQAVFVPEIGRLAFFALRQGTSPFRLDKGRQGRLPSPGERFFNIGGDWLWPVAQARWGLLSGNGQDWPPPAVLADRPWDCSAWTDADGSPCVLLTREYGAPLHIQVSRRFRLEPDAAALVVKQSIERTAPSDIPVALWNISQIDRAEQVALPIDADSKFRGGLAVLMGRKPGRRRLVPCGDAVVYRVQPGQETKLGSDSRRGWIAAARGTNAIVETVMNRTEGEYPDGGCVIELYSNHDLGYSEIETLSPEAELAPGQVLENTLRIELAVTEEPLEPCPFAEFVRALMAAIPPDQPPGRE